MIQIENVTKIYSGKVKAVDHISLTVNEGEIIGFIGPNGAGKTTTIKMMTGHSVSRRRFGSVEWDRYHQRTAGSQTSIRFCLRQSGYIFLRLKGIEYFELHGRYL